MNYFSLGAGAHIKGWLYRDVRVNREHRLAVCFVEAPSKACGEEVSPSKWSGQPAAIRFFNACSRFAGGARISVAVGEAWEL